MWCSYFKITNHTANQIDNKLYKDAASVETWLARLQNSPEVCLFNVNVKTSHHITYGYIFLSRPGLIYQLVIGTIIVSRSEFHSLLDERRSLLRKRNKIWGWNINVRAISVWPHSRRWRIGNIACWSTGWILAKFGSETLIYNRTLIFVFQAVQAGLVSISPLSGHELVDYDYDCTQLGKRDVNLPGWGCCSSRSCHWHPPFMVRSSYSELVK